MTFLDGALLGFLALASIPIIIHLLNRQNFKVVDWAAIRFLLESMQKNSRRLQLRDLILLILRTLAILLIVLALARPLLSSGSLFPGVGGTNAVILLDNSMSMTVQRGNSTRFADAQHTAEKIIASLPRGSRAGVIEFNATSHTIARPSRDLAFIHETIAKSQPTDGGTNLIGAMTDAVAMLHKMGGGGTIYLISDMQKNSFPVPGSAGWTQWKDLLAQMHSQKNEQISLVKIGTHTPSIVSVNRIALADPLVHADSPISLIATVVNHAVTPARNVNVGLYSGTDAAKMSKVASAVIPELQATANVTLSTRIPSAGQQRLEVRLDPQALPACARRRMVVPVLKHLRVLLVNGSNNAVVGSQAGVNGAFFIRMALEPQDGGENTTGIHNGTDLIHVKTIRMTQLSSISLTTYQAIIFSNVAAVPSRWAAALHGFVQHGGAMIFFVGSQVQPRNYSSVLFQKAGLLPAALTNSVPLRQAGHTGLNLQITDLSHPIFSFFKTQAYRTFLLQPIFNRAFEVVAPTATQPAKTRQGQGAGSISAPTLSSSIIARFANGMPAILTRQVGKGTVVLFTTSAGKNWSNFPLCPSFVMLLRRTLLFAVQSAQPQLNGTVGKPLGVQVPTRFSTVSFTQLNPGGSTRMVSPTAWADGRTTVLLKKVTNAGFYTLTHPPITDTFAVNWPARESNLDSFSLTDLPREFPGLPVHAFSPASIRAAIGNAGVSLWPIFLALAVACLLAESILALYWAPEGHA